jgi:hypothetical protein
LFWFLLCHYPDAHNFFTFSPESAAIQALLAPHQQGQVFPETIEVLQTKELDGVVSVMLRYQMSDEGLIFDCDYVYETRNRYYGWTTLGGGGGCTSGPVEEQRVGIGGGTRSSNGDSTSRVYGLVSDPEITSIEVLWDDEWLERVDVINGSFLAIRKGKNGWNEVAGYDADDNIIYSSEAPQPAPGKSLP